MSKHVRIDDSGGSLGARLIGKDIMVVDDEIHVAGLVDDMLTRYGARVQIAHTATDAYNRIRGGVFDLVVCDQNLPDLTGQNLQQLVLRTSHAPQRFLFITGAASLSDRHSSEDRVAFLKKPFRMHELVAAIDRLLDEDLS